ncbi:MAG: DUF4190 domain-containing protein [Planctomycetaceae bacterium]
MTQTIATEDKTHLDQPVSNPQSVSNDGPVIDFDYKPVPVFVPVTVFLGVSSAIALLAEFGLAICLVGIVTGIMALRKIRNSNGEYGGARLAKLGLTACVFFLIAGTTTHIYAYVTEVPEGHYRVNFPKDISEKQFRIVNGQRTLHPDVARYENQKIFIKGYMYNTRKQTGLADFILLKDNGKCCFGGNPKPYDMMHVKMQNGLTVDKLDGLVAVAGVLRCYPSVKDGEGAVYVIEATQAGRARTAH